MPDDARQGRSHIPARAIWPLTAAITAVMLVVRLGFLLSKEVAQGRAVDLSRVVFEEVVGALVSVPYLYLLLHALRRWPLTEEPRLRWALRLTAIFTAAGILHAPVLFAVRGAVAMLLGMQGYGLLPSPADWINEAINDFLPVVATVAGMTAAEFLLEARARERRAFALERSLLEAELRTVRLQLQPHFLFNALNTISATMYEDPAAADVQLGRLAELLRASLRSTEAQEVPLADELAIVEQYVGLMQARFPGALDWTVSLEAGTERVLVPSMCLQPLVENAVRHGALATRGSGRVQLTARFDASNRATNDTSNGATDGEMLELRVHDDGDGLTPGRDALASGTGLSSTVRRLALLHGEHGTVRAGNASAGGFEVVLRLPARSAAPARA